MSSGLTAAMAFGLSMILALVGQGSSYVINLRLKGVYQEILDEAREAGLIPSGVPINAGLDPDSLIVVAGWVADASQILSATLGPVLGLIFLRQTISQAVAWLFAVAVLACLTFFLIFVARSSPRSYHSAPIRPTIRGHERQVFGPFSPVAVAIFVANGCCGVLAVLLA